MDFGLIAQSQLAVWLVWFFNLFQAIVGLGIVIFVHELGHFLVAKLCGVKCEKFYVGFDVPIRIGPIRFPRTLGKFTWGETEYGIGIIPLGGYVKMLGQDDDPRNAAREAERVRVAKKTAAQPAAETEETPAGPTEPPESEAVAAPASYELDPRSYPAQPVWQRMSIISAGVIMNLVTAVMFGAGAYLLGVSYVPAIIGGVSGGDPAWVAGIEPMDQIVQIGRRSEARDHLRWRWDLVQSIAAAGLSNPRESIDLLVQKPSGERYWVTLTPTERAQVPDGLPTVGIRSLGSTTVLINDTFSHLLPETVRETLEYGDRIVAVNDISLERQLANHRGDIPAPELEQLLYKFRAEPVQLTVERPKSGEEQYDSFSTTVAPRRVRTLGLVMEMGPIVSIRKGSPAQDAGFRPGDVIRSIDGQPIDDPLRLPEDAEHWKDETLMVEVLRTENGQQRTVTLSVVASDEFRYISPAGAGELKTLEPIGVSYETSLVVAQVMENSPAANAIQPGDRITEVQLVAADDDAPRIPRGFYNEPIDLTDSVFTWADVHSVLQQQPPEAQVKLAYERNGRTREAVFETIEVDGWYNSERGLVFQQYTRIHREESLMAASRLGARATVESVQRVVDMLGRLITGRISIGHLGGPVAIVTVAGSEASEGYANLLMFLMFLSANLAILNFLPIPALDGGHFVFLLWEWVTGKPVDERVQGTLTLVGIVCLLSLIVFVTFNDVTMLTRLFSR